MLYPVYYSINPTLLQQVTIPATKNILALRIDANNTDMLSKAFRIATTLDPVQNFCLHITLPFDDETVNHLIAFFFFPNYYKSSGPEIVVEHEVLKKFDGTENTLMQGANTQGFYNLNFKSLQAEGINYIRACDALKIEKVKTGYRQLLHQMPSKMESLFVEIENPDTFPIIERALIEEGQLFKTHQPLLFELKEKNKELYARLQEAERKAVAAAQEIKTQASHIQTLRTQSQATYLQQFYNNEYEVLPLWYKRFGHIIKAFMGKRTLKSLFIDNEKKYND